MPKGSRLAQLPDVNESLLPNLTQDQALFMSFMADGDPAELAASKYEKFTKMAPPLEKWYDDPEFQSAVKLLDGGRLDLFRGMTHALTGKAFRTLSALMDSPKDVGQIKGLELFLRLHGMLMDRVKHEKPDALKEVMNKLSGRYVVTEADHHAKELEAPKNDTGE